MPTLVSVMRNEGPFILEWLAYHRMIGFDDILIVTNHCSDGSDDLVRACANTGICRHHDVQVPGGKRPQKIAYDYIAKQEILSPDWTMVLDADEFLNIHLCGGHLSDLLTVADDRSDLLAVNWICFGSAGREYWEFGQTIEQFTQGSDPARGFNGMVKSLIRDPLQFKRLSNHAPNGWGGTGQLWFENMNGRRFEIPQEDYGAMHKHLRVLGPKRRSHDWAQINHYATRTPDSFALRRARGPGWSLDQDRHNADYFSRFNQSPREELSIQRHLPALHQLLEDIRADAEIHLAEQACLESYRAALDNLPR